MHAVLVTIKTMAKYNVYLGMVGVCRANRAQLDRQTPWWYKTTIYKTKKYQQRRQQRHSIRPRRMGTFYRLTVPGIRKYIGWFFIFCLITDFRYANQPDKPFCYICVKCCIYTSAVNALKSGTLDHEMVRREDGEKKETPPADDRMYAIHTFYLIEKANGE